MKHVRIRAQAVSHDALMRLFIDNAKAIRSAEGLRMPDVIRTFITGAAARLRCAMFEMIGDHETAKSESETVERALKPIREPQSRKLLVSMSEILAEALEADPVDFIGPVFMELLAHEGMGQFFTPREVSRLIAELTLPPSPEEAPLERGFISIQEPTCGVGGMVLAANEVLRDRGFDPTTQTRWLMIELDRVAVDAAWLQVALTKVPAPVQWGNTLSLEMSASWPTPQLLRLKAEEHSPRKREPRRIGSGR